MHNLRSLRIFVAMCGKKGEHVPLGTWKLILAAWRLTVLAVQPQSFPQECQVTSVLV